MKTHPKKNRKGFTLVELLVVIAIIAALAALSTDQVFRALKRAETNTDISNLKEIHKAMTMFAMDNDGLFPSEELTEEYDLSGSKSSNELFRQMFASGQLTNDSEELFWSKSSEICTQRPPDNVTTESGNFDEQATLKPGDVAYAYIPEQTNTDEGGRPLVFDSPMRASGTEFDLEQRNGKALIMRVGGSVRAETINGKTNKVLDGSKENIFSVNAEVWGNMDEIEIAYPEQR